MNLTRRQLISSSLASASMITIGSSSTSLPGFLLQAADSSAKSDKSVLVVVQLSGGNDGLNTVVPFTDPVYYNQRPKLAIPKANVLSIDKSLGFHPVMQGFAELLEDDKLAVVQGVGYPNPNRSHFESMDIWHTCRRKNDIREEGWLGSILATQTEDDSTDIPGLHLGPEKQPLALSSRSLRIASVKSLEQFKLPADSKTLSNVVAKGDDQGNGGLLGFVQSSTQAAIRTSEQLEEIRSKNTSAVAYPNSALARKLETAAQLIDSPLATRVYYVSIDGFDTHAQQADAHTSLLRQVSSSVKTFVDDITQRGHGDRVMVMCFSEFGRRVKENASAGTDHGAAAPMFFAGSRVKAGIHGSHPSLTDLQQGDLKHQFDFRELYASVLENWMKWPSADVLGGQFKPLDVFV